MILHNMNISGRVLPTTEEDALEGVLPVLRGMLEGQGLPLFTLTWADGGKDFVLLDNGHDKIQTRPELLYRVLLGSNLKHEAATLETTPTELLLDRLSGRR